MCKECGCQFVVTVRNPHTVSGGNHGKGNNVTPGLCGRVQRDVEGDAIQIDEDEWGDGQIFCIDPDEDTLLAAFDL